MSLKYKLKVLSKFFGIQEFIMRIKEFLILENESLEKIKIREKFYKQFVKEEDIVFDVGANLGNRTEIFLRLGAKVIAVEPNPKLVRKLVNKYSNRIIVENCGLGSHHGIEILNVGSTHTISSFSKEHISKMQLGRFNEFNWSRKILCPIRTLDYLILNYGSPAFVKVDVEGFEAEVLKGLSQKVKCLSIEYNVPDNLDLVIQCLNELKRVNSNYHFNFSVADSMEFFLDEWLDYINFIDLVNSNVFIDSSWGDVYARLG
jgi:FkbM family methyltransferase